MNKNQPLSSLCFHMHTTYVHVHVQMSKALHPILHHTITTTHRTTHHTIPTTVVRPDLVLVVPIRTRQTCMPPYLPAVLELNILPRNTSPNT